MNQNIVQMMINDMDSSETIKRRRNKISKQRIIVWVLITIMVILTIKYYI